MRLATVRTDSSATSAVRIDGESAVYLPASDLGELMQNPNWRDEAATHSGRQVDVADVAFVAPIAVPRKVVCVGLNYRAHIEEMGRELPSMPTLFAKYPEAIIGPRDDIVLPPESAAMDWEGELAVVIGSTVRRADQAAARQAIAGYTDSQRRHCSRLSVPNLTMVAGQNIRIDNAAWSRAGDPRRIRSGRRPHHDDRRR